MGIFELLSGHPPFESAYPMQIYSKVMKGIGKVNFPKSCQGSAETLIKALLQKDPQKRLPMLPGGFTNVESARWYSDFLWQRLRAGTLEPPYKPVVKSPTDLSNFKVREEDAPQEINCPDSTDWDRDF